MIIYSLRAETAPYNVASQLYTVIFFGIMILIFTQLWSQVPIADSYTTFDQDSFLPENNYLYLFPILLPYRYYAMLLNHFPSDFLNILTSVFLR